MTATQVNVRAEPSAEATQLGVLAPFIRVQIVGRDSGGDWYAILYSDSPDGKAWVTAQYINVQNRDAIPVIGGAAETPTPSDATGTPAASGTIIQQVNVRKGPGTDFDAVGTLNAKETAALTGKDTSGSWVQIEYAAAPHGKGWIAAAYVQGASLDALPVIGDSNKSTADTATSTPPPMTATAVAALQDNDSLEAPATDVTFSATGTRSLIYTSDVSAPQGAAGCAWP